MKINAKLLVACPEKDEDMFYATRFHAPDRFTLLILDSKKIALSAELEYERMKKESVIDDVVIAADLAKRPGYPDPYKYGPTNPITIMQFLKDYRVEAVEVPANFPAGLAYNLMANGIFVQPRKWSGVESTFFPERAIKTLEELAYIEATQRILEEVFLMAREEIQDARVRDDGTLIRPDGKVLTVEFLRGMMKAEFARKDCESKFLIIAVGDQAVDPHASGSGPLRARTWIVMDIFPRGPMNYWADMTRTVSKWDPGEEEKSIYRTVLNGQRYGVDRIKEGIDGFDIHAEINEGFKMSDYETGIINGVMQGFPHGTGHGVGLEIHEPPRIAKIRGQILKAGHVVTVEPGLYYLAHGGVRIEDMVLVTKDGCRNLTQMPKDLEWAIIP